MVGWSRYSKSRNSWLYSRRTVEAIAKFNELFPDVVDFIGACDMQKSPFDITEIFPAESLCVIPLFAILTFLFNCLIDCKCLCVIPCCRARFIQLQTFLRKDVKGSRTVTNVDASLLDTQGLRVVESSLPKITGLSTSTSDDCFCVDVAPTDVFAVRF